MTAATTLATVGNIILTDLTNAGAAQADVQTVENYATMLINYAETKVAAGATKLAAVIAGVKAYVAEALPALKVDWANFQTQLTAFINGVVAFLHTVVQGVTDVVNDIKGAGSVIKSLV
jgi:hypothetical protein